MFCLDHCLFFLFDCPLTTLPTRSSSVRVAMGVFGIQLRVCQSQDTISFYLGTYVYMIYSLFHVKLVLAITHDNVEMASRTLLLPSGLTWLVL